MKPFFLSVLTGDHVPTSVFKHIDDTRAKLDKTELERLFANAPKKVTSPTSPDVPTTPSKKATQVELFDSKRSDAVNIGLKRFKMPHDAIRSALFKFDDALDEEKLASLQTIAPTPEEIEIISRYDGPASELGQVELFFTTMSTVPALHDRLQYFLHRHRFDAQLAKLKAELDACESGVRALQTSTNLRQLFELVLSVSNYMNGGTIRGGVSGFKIDTLMKLKNSKSSDNTCTLLDFVVTNFKSSNPSAHESLKSELAVLQTATETQFAALQADVNQMALLSRKLRKSLDAVPQSERNSSNDKFYTYFSQFDKTSSSAVESVTARLKKLDASVSDLIRYFAEDATKSSMDALFSLFHDFMRDYTRAENEMVRKAEQAAEQARRAFTSPVRARSATANPPGVPSPSPSPSPQTPVMMRFQ